MAKGKSRTSLFYNKPGNEDHRQKHSDDNNSGKNGKYAHTKAYKRRHENDRLKLKKRGAITSKQHVVYPNGKAKAGNAYANLAAGARKGAARRA